MMDETVLSAQQRKVKIWHDAPMEPVHKESAPGVLIYRPVDAAGDSHKRLADAGCRVEICDSGESLDAALRHFGPVQALLCSSIRGQRLDRPRINALEDLRIIAKYTIGVDDVDVEAATEQGVLVTHCPTEANVGGVAEGTIALMLTLLKKIESRNASVRRGQWRDENLRGVYLGARGDGYAGITLGIVGLGRIGRRVAELMAPWKVRLIAADPYIEADVFAQCGVESVALDELLARADVVTLHCNLTAETEGLIDSRRLSYMRPNALLINTARGRIVDVDAVCDALERQRLGGAAFDVLPEEPPPPGARVLATDERVILSPHMVAANQGGTLSAAIPWATQSVLDALAGEVPAHVYNAEAVSAWCRRFANKPLIAT